MARALEETEASVERAMDNSRRYLNKVGRKARFRPRHSTDATAFDELFLKKSGIALYKTRPKDTPCLRMPNGADFVPPWQP